MNPQLPAFQEIILASIKLARMIVPEPTSHASYLFQHQMPDYPPSNHYPRSNSDDSTYGSSHGLNFLPLPATESKRRDATNSADIKPKSANDLNLNYD